MAHHQTLNTLASFGLYLKPDSLTYDKNIIFENSASKLIFNTTNNDLIDLLNKDNVNIVVTNIYVPPRKSPTQNLGSNKKTLATCLMANSVLMHGIRIGNCLVEGEDIKQG